MTQLFRGNTHVEYATVYIYQPNSMRSPASIKPNTTFTSHPNPQISTMISLLCFAIAACLGILNINASQPRRPFLFFVESIFAVLSYHHVPSLGVSPYNGLLRMFLIIWHMHMGCILFVQRYTPPSGYADTWDWRSGYKMLFNVRWLGTARQVADISRPYNSRSAFIRNRVISLVTLYGIDRLHEYAFDYMHPELFLDDFVPLKETFFRRLLLSAVSAGIDRPTFRETSIRIAVTVRSTWQPYSTLTSCHDIFAIGFVGSGIDEPEDWPPFFGNLKDAYTVTRFWNKFWHKALYRTAISYASLVPAHILRLSRTSFFGGLSVKFLVFVLSGIIHAIVLKHAGDYTCGYWHEFEFYLLNFVAAMFEVAVQSAVRKLRRDRGCQEHEMTDKILGFLWVFGFRFWSLPKAQFRQLSCAI